MAKLYAELTSDKGGRVASKGGDDGITVRFYRGNKQAYIVTLENKQLTVYKDDGPLLHDFID